MDVPNYRFSAPALYHRIRNLARLHTEAESAPQLNQTDVKTVKGKHWTPRRVMDFRLSNAIASGFTTTAELRLPETGYLTSAEAAEQLGVSQTTLQKWYRLGVLNGKHDGGQAPLWIRWTDGVSERLRGALLQIHGWSLGAVFVTHNANGLIKY